MNDPHAKLMLATSHLSGASSGYIDHLYELYLQDQNQVPHEWKAYFDSLQTSSDPDISHDQIRAYFKSTANRARQSTLPTTTHQKQANVMTLLNAYRLYGHHHANLDPLQLAERKQIPELDLSFHHLSQDNFSDEFTTDSALCGGKGTLQAIYQSLLSTYSGSVGVEYMHITDHQEVHWIRDRLEESAGHYPMTPEEQKKVLHDLGSAEGLEKFLGNKYVGQKRFSLEGGDSLIPLINCLIQKAGDYTVKEFVVGMAHRGRLNVLINVMGKSPSELYDEFEGKKQGMDTSGDVKYHLGFSSDIETRSGNLVHLALAFNPSHLEIISPVVEGSVRARLRRRNDLDSKSAAVPILIHGDAAFAGQGVVMETFNFSQARGYSTGGTIHIVVNNQIGFTTSNPLDSRSTLYCTDIAKVVQAPIFHVNADDPEAVFYLAKMAFDYRMKFKKDVVIDLVCYRRHGHNEADDPSMTQPVMYQKIKALPSAFKQYSDKLIASKVVDQEAVDELVSQLRDRFQRGEQVISTVDVRDADPFAAEWGIYVGQPWDTAYDSTVNLKKIKALSDKLSELPDSFTVHRTVKRLLADREKMAKGDLSMNWGFAEIMAYASLIEEGYPVRLSGQDVGRGTFSHRHAVLHDAANGDAYIPLSNINDKNNQAIIIDSVLSEEAVLGFEFGYATAEPNVLVIWEAQFGDFANGAQVVIDQFISSGEQKWNRLCGLVMLLPHGYEGQGPEHSSARLERYLQLCAQQNMQVCVPTTPAQIFHLLRRQIKRTFRKPLIVMTPKSLLRHKLAVSPLKDLAEGHYHLVIPEIDPLDKKRVRKIVLCSGKVYYDLLEKRREQSIIDIAIFRVEQLYPFPEKVLNKALQAYPQVKEIVWCQEEPKNQGAWFSSQHHMFASLLEGQVLSYVGRGFSASPAVGNVHLHIKQQNALVEEALN